MMYGQPYLSLTVVDTAQVAPSYSKCWMSLYSLHVTGLREREGERERGREIEGEIERERERERKREGERETIKKYQMYFYTI